MFTLQCVEKPRPGGNQHGAQLRFKGEEKRAERGGLSATLTRAVVERLVSERVQLLQDLVHGLFFVLQLLQLGEFGTGGRRLWVEIGVGTGGRVEQRSVLRGTHGLGGTGPTHLSRQGKALCLTTVVRHCFSLA